MVRQVLKRKPLNHHGVWWVLLLLYSHVVYTSMTVLNCPSITDTDGATSAVREGGREKTILNDYTVTLSPSAVVCEWRGEVFHWWPHSSGPTGHSSAAGSCSPHPTHCSAVHWTMEEGEKDARDIEAQRYLPGTKTAQCAPYETYSPSDVNTTIRGRT